MMVNTIDTTDPHEIGLVHAYIMTHETSDDYPSFHRSVYNDDSATLFHGFDLDSEVVASASKGYAYVTASVLNDFLAFCEARKSPLKVFIRKEV